MPVEKISRGSQRASQPIYENAAATNPEIAPVTTLDIAPETTAMQLSPSKYMTANESKVQSNDVFIGTWSKQHTALAALAFVVVAMLSLIVFQIYQEYARQRGHKKSIPLTVPGRKLQITMMSQKVVYCCWQKCPSN